MSSFQHDIAGGSGNLIVTSVQSPNFVHNSTGWQIKKDGSAEFNNLEIRGTFNGNNFIINSAGIFFYSATPAADNLSYSATNGTGTDAFGNAYLAGDTEYTFVGLGRWLAIQRNAGSITALVATTHMTSWSPTGAAVEFDVSGDLTLTGTVKVSTELAVGNAYWVYAPSNDVTGVTDATVINGLFASSLEVQLTAGTYYTDATIEIPGGGILRGAGRSGVSTFGMTVIQAVSSVHAVIASAGWLEAANSSIVAPTTVSDLKVYGAGNATHGVVLQSWDSLVSDVYVQDVSGDGIRFDAVSQDGTKTISSGSGVNNRVRHCTVDVCARGITTSDPNGIFTDGFCLENIVASVSGAAAISLGWATGWHILGNHVYGLTSHGISVSQMFMTRITGNYIETWGSNASSGTYLGIDAGFNGGNSDEGSGSVISGNTMNLTTAPGNSGSTVVAVGFACDNSNTASVSITGNVARCEPSSGFAAAYSCWLGNKGSSSNLIATSTGNLYTGNWTSSGAIHQTPNGGTITVTAGT